MGYINAYKGVIGMNNDRRILELALQGLETERQRIESEIIEIRKRLHHSAGTRNRVVLEGRPDTPKRNLSDAGRKAISDAMKNRWAKYRKYGSKR